MNTMGAIDSRQSAIIDDFSQLNTWEDRYRHIIEMGKQLPPMSEADKIEDLKVRGCQAQVWLKAELHADKTIHFIADSDALIVKGLIAILLKIYSDRTAQEILSTEPQFISALGLAQHLSPSRANGLVAMIKQIKYYALGYQAMN